MKNYFGPISVMALVLAMSLGCAAGGPGRMSGPMEVLPELTGEAAGDPNSRCEGTWTIEDGVGRYECFPRGGFGCWVTLKREAGVIMAAGATKVVVSMKIPDDTRINFFIGEDGVAGADAGYYDGEAGADGEQYTSAELVGDGTKRDYVVEFADLTKVTFFGNQEGNDRLDVQALDQIGIYVPVDQGKSVLEVYSIRFE